MSDRLEGRGTSMSPGLLAQTTLYRQCRTSLRRNSGRYNPVSCVEQTPSSVALGVLIAPDTTVAAAGGFFIQTLPSAKETARNRIISKQKPAVYISLVFWHYNK
ncbi:33 kDa chaperonin [Sporomusa silvacetica DSM 10669]|uniref:33 kDa chaperonin n=1 Tax=Sporomusa silvacetica DSM 10669 TaxID=1123289 RepID=A0ABZ3IL30_9FIRM|nr:33 kDa chaperonin [Sporomusa silvacetica DSM 10669]